MKLLIIEDTLFEDFSAAERQQLSHLVEGKYQIKAASALEEKEFENVEIAFGDIDKASLPLMPSLLWLQLPYAGVENRVNPALYRNPAFTLTNASGVYGEPLSDHILAFVFGFSRSFHLYRDQMKQQLWQPLSTPKDIAGQTIIVIGLGDIGKKTAQKCKALQMHVIGIKRSVSEKPDYVDALYFDTETSLDSILPQADVVALCLPATDKTQYVMDAKKLSLMKDDALLVNIGRGSLVDETALIKELQSGRIQAGLDVMAVEPLQKESPLWRLPNCWITPHMAGRSNGRIARLFSLFFENYNAYIQKQPLKNTIDFTLQY